MDEVKGKLERFIKIINHPIKPAKDIPDFVLPPLTSEDWDKFQNGMIRCIIKDESKEV